MAQILEDERENNLPELSVDDWNEIYEEMSRDINQYLA
jgi:hypothetical protein